jgi:hypothetical protein
MLVVLRVKENSLRFLGGNIFLYKVLTFQLQAECQFSALQPLALLSNFTGIYQKKCMHVVIKITCVPAFELLIKQKMGRLKKDIFNG